MPNVVRFALSTAKTLYVPGAGTFIDGILDVDANNLPLLTKTRYLVQPYRAVELGTVDAATPPPSLPAVPGPPSPDPYPQYLTAAEAASSPELRAALVPWATDWQISESGGDLEFRPVGASDWAARIFDASSDFQIRGAFVGHGFNGFAAPGKRLPYGFDATIDGATLTSAHPGDKVGMVLSVNFVNGFSGEAGLGMDNAGFAWGANDFILTGLDAGDIDGITDVQGRLSEVHLRTPGSTVNNVTSVIAESVVDIQGVGATVTGWLASMIARAPENRPTPKATIANAASLFVGSPAANTATNQYALYVAGPEKSFIGGDIQMNPDPSEPKVVNAFHGGFKGKTVVIGNPSFYPSGASLTVQSSADDDVVSWLKGRGGQTDDILRIGRDTLVHARFDKHGRFITNQNEAPLDADLSAGDLALYIDNTSGAMKLMIKGKDAGGTVRTGSVTLS